MSDIKLHWVCLAARIDASCKKEHHGRIKSNKLWEYMEEMCHCFSLLMWFPECGKTYLAAGFSGLPTRKANI